MPAKPDWMAPRGAPWRALAERRVYQNPWLEVFEYDALAPTGKMTLYGVVRFRNRALAVLPLHADGTVTLVGQNRFPVPGYSWEIPEGGGALDEAPLDGAKRELKEEAGLEAAEWRSILTYQLSNSVTDEQGEGFLALGLTPTASCPDETESLALARRPFREALDLAVSGAMPDMITVAMLLRAYHLAATGGLPPELARLMLS